MLKKKDIIAYHRYANGVEIFQDYHGREYELTNKIVEEIEKNGEYVFKHIEVYRGEDYDLVFKPNHTFELDLIFQGFVRGCSSAQAKYKERKYIDIIPINADKHEHYMFLSDFEDLILSHERVDEIHGLFTYCKKGSNYALKLIKRLDN